MLLALSQNRFRRRLTRAVTLPIGLLLLLSGISVWQTTRLLSALKWVDHTNQVISQANSVQKLLLDQETGFRGYLLTGKQEFLEPYEQANEVIDSSLSQLRNLVLDNPGQMQRVDQLILQSQQWQQRVLPALDRRQTGEPEPSSNLEERKQYMDQMRQQIAEFIAIEEELRRQRSQMAQATTQSVIFTSLLLALVVGVVLAYFLHRQILQVSQNYQDALHTAQVKTEEALRSAAALKYELTERQHAEAELREQEQLFRSTFNQAAVGIAHVSLDGEWLRVNQKLCDIVGYSYQELLQRTFQEITYPEDLNIDLACIRQVLADEIQTYAIEKRYIRKNRSLVWVNLTVSLVRDESRQPKYFISVVEDISDRKRAEAELHQLNLTLEQRVIERTTQLEEANQELEAFTYSVSHDLRAPLRTIQGFAAALLEDCGDRLGEDCRSYIDSITDDSVQMNGLISDLLNYSRLTRLQISLQPTSLDEVVTEALKQLKTEIQDSQAQIKVASPLPQVMAHRSTLVQVVANLLGNAIKFVDPNIQPKIDIFATIERQDNQDWIRFCITDNGIGIAPEHQERVFRVFERLHGAERYPGTGIGLAIVRKGLDRMGGRVGVESQIKHGSRFWIALPKAVLT